MTTIVTTHRHRARRGLARDVAEIRARTAELLGEEHAELLDDADDLVLLGDHLPAVAVAARERLAARAEMDETAADLLALALAAQDLGADCHAHVAEQRSRLDAAVERGLGQLRAVTSSADLLNRACRVAVESCGVHRVLLSRVEGDHWIPWMAYSADDDDLASRIRRDPVPLASSPPERRVLEERRATLVLDSRSAVRLHEPIAPLSPTRSHVVAPIIPAGRVVGFIHADHHPTGRAVDETDRDAVWAFAEGVGRLYERAVILERLAAQRSQVRETFDVAERIVSEMGGADLELVRDQEDSPAGGDAGSGYGALPTSESIDALLTAREREVLRLMVKGCSNGAIAERLVIREGTVKSHVKHILRKVGAVNRAEAISRYLGMVDGS